MYKGQCCDRTGLSRSPSVEDTLTQCGYLELKSIVQWASGVPGERAGFTVTVGDFERGIVNVFNISLIPAQVC